MSNDNQCAIIAGTCRGYEPIPAAAMLNALNFRAGSIDRWRQGRLLWTTNTEPFNQGVRAQLCIVHCNTKSTKLHICAFASPGDTCTNTLAGMTNATAFMITACHIITSTFIARVTTKTVTSNSSSHKSKSLARMTDNTCYCVLVMAEHNRGFALADCSVSLCCSG